MAKATCEVSEKDYLQYFGGRGAMPVPPPTLWTGEERRRDGDRRRGHDRRWTAQTGRRFLCLTGRRATDRRAGTQ